MGSVGAPEVLVIMVLALLVLGPERLPQAARTMGRWVAEFRKLTGSLQAEVRDVVDDVMRPVNETVTVATDSFTSTVTSTPAAGDCDSDTGSPTNLVEPDGTATQALPSEATSEPRIGEPGPEAPLAADVPLETAPTSSTPPVDPSLN